MAVCRIHVNQHVLRANRNTGARDPVLTVKRGRSNVYCHSVEIKGPCRVVYSPDKPLSCGAVCWVECDSDDAIISSGPKDANHGTASAEQEA